MRDDVPFSEEGSEEGDPPVDLRAEGVAVTRSPRTLLGSVALFAPTAYAAAVVMRDSPHPLWVRAGIGVSALVVLARITPPLDELGADARVPAKTAVASAAVAATLTAGIPLHQVAASRSASSVSLVIAVVLAGALAAASAVRAGVSLSGLGGIGLTPRGQIATSAARVSAAWIAVSVIAVFAALPQEFLLAQVAAPFALVGAVALTIGHAVSSGRRRRLELGARERHELMLASTTLALPVAILAATGLDPLHSASVMGALLPTLIAATGISLAVGVLVAHRVEDPVRTQANVGNAWLLLTIAFVGATSTALAPERSRVIAFGFGLLLGVFAPRIARAIGIEGAHAAALRKAIGKARDASGAGDPSEVARGVLGAMRTIAGEPAPRELGRLPAPRCILFSPLKEIILDAAGEPRTRDPLPSVEAVPDPDAPSAVSRVVPAELLRLLVEEPLGVVRTEVLDALRVRRPDLRAALRFCEDRDAAAVVGLLVDGELDGILVLPEGANVSALGHGSARGGAIRGSLGLRECRALRVIARLCAMRLSLEAALARAAARAHRAELRAREVEVVLDRAHDRESRLSAAVAATARPLQARGAGGYAPAARALLAEIDALAPSRHHLVITHRPGSDPAPWMARLHARSSSARGPLHIADATRDPKAWGDPDASPIELARGGTLLITSAASLPREAQRRLVSALSFREGPGRDPTPVELRVVLALPTDDPDGDDLSRLRDALDAALFGHLREAPLRVPPLARRIEDLHALALDRLASLGEALRSAPLGLAPAALAVLIEHPWPGDDLELEAALAGAAQRARGVRVEREDVLAVLSRPDPRPRSARSTASEADEP